MDSLDLTSGTAPFFTNFFFNITGVKVLVKIHKYVNVLQMHKTNYEFQQFCKKHIHKK